MVGREHEQKELRRLYESGRSEFVAIFGRKRVGKTYLVDETFPNQITFRHTGLSPEETLGKTGLLKAQLDHFERSLRLHGGNPEAPLSNWFDAFFELEKYLMQVDNGERQLIFLDELPWMDTARSNFIMAFEGFWNTWACHRKNIMLIICGSANSWILNKLINNHGGLYNRVTYEMKLAPFTLKECETYLRSNNVALSRYDIAQAYMILGGIPYYLGYFRRELSLAQNIDELLFSHHAKLEMEYDRLFSSVFSQPETVKRIVEALSGRRIGYTRSEIVDSTGISDGGTLSQCLLALIACDFVVKYIPFGKGMKEHYKLVDPFCLFYLHFVKKNPSQDRHFWQHHLDSPENYSWRGLAFENVCFQHVDEIKQALSIGGVITRESAWTLKQSEDGGAQIDMLIIRNDHVVNLCEIKFTNEIYCVDKEEYLRLMHRQEALRKELPRSMSIYPTLITTFGVKLNEYSRFFTNTIALDDLFG